MFCDLAGFILPTCNVRTATWRRGGLIEKPDRVLDAHFTIEQVISETAIRMSGSQHDVRDNELFLAQTSVSRHARLTDVINRSTTANVYIIQ